MKRPALRFDSPSPSDLSGSKRVMAAPSFDVHRAESTHQNLMAGPPLDVKRAQAAYQNVQALNTQFASWVQSQLQNHPDELWEDGVTDYLKHASGIMEKFKDVVDWLRSNAAKPAVAASSGMIIGQKNLLPVQDSNKQASQADIKNSFVKQDSTVSNLQKPDFGGAGLFSAGPAPKFTGFFSDQKKLIAQSDNTKTAISQDIQNGATGLVAPMSFSRFQSSPSQSSGLFSFSQRPGLSGDQGEGANVEAPRDVDEEDEPEKPSSPSLKKAEEKGVAVVFETKCKVYRKSDDPADKAWKDIGVGQLCIKCKEGAAKATKDSKPTIVIRNDVGRILLNALIYSGIKMNIQKNTIASIFHTSGDVQGEDGSVGVVSRMYLLRMKNEEETTKLAEAIKEFTPAE